MTHWTRARKASFVIHTAFVAIPFTISTVSAYLFWYALFQTYWMAVPLVMVIDLLALTGLVLSIVKIASPFVWLRHLLPFVSIVPLGWELRGVLIQHNEPVLSSVVAGLVTLILVIIAWQCFRTIEALFVIDAVAAERERAREQMRAIGIRLAGLRAMDEAVQTFFVDYQQPHRASLAAPQEAPQLPTAPAYADLVEGLPEATTGPQPDHNGDGELYHAEPQGERLDELKARARRMRAATPQASWAATALAVGRSVSTVRGWVEQTNGEVE